MAVYGLVVAALGLLQGDAGLFQIGGSVRAVDGVEHIALPHLVALLNIAGEDLAVHQRLDGIGIGRVQGAGAAQGVGDILTGGGRLGVGHITARSAPAAAAHDQHDGHHQHDSQRGKPFPVFLGECGCAGRGLCLRRLPSGLVCCILFLFPDHAFPPMVGKWAYDPLCTKNLLLVVYRILPKYTSVQISFHPLFTKYPVIFAQKKTPAKLFAESCGCLHSF